MHDINVITEFIESCRQSEKAFQKWLSNSTHEHLKGNFSEMAEILRCVQVAIAKAEKIQSEIAAKLDRGHIY